MSKLSYCTLYSSIDCAKARRELKEANWNDEKLQEVLTNCFFDGSTASAETAVSFVTGAADSPSKALLVADIVKSLPTAVPNRTASALSHLCVFIALSFNEEKCRAPLQSFCYAERAVKHVAIEAVVSFLQQYSSRDVKHFRNVLERSREFFEELMTGDPDITARYLAIKGLIRIGSTGVAVIRENIVGFILSLGLTTNLSTSNDSIPEESGFEAFTCSELASLTSNNKSLGCIVRRAFLRSLEFTSISSIHQLWIEHRPKFFKVLPIVGYDVSLVSLTLIVASNACDGQLLTCRQSLGILDGILSQMKSTTQQLSSVVLLLLALMCVAVGALAQAAGATDLAKDTSNILQIVSVTRAKGGPPECSFIGEARTGAKQLCCSRAALTFGLLHKILSLWNHPGDLSQWFEEDLGDLLRAVTLDDGTVTDETVVDSFAKMSSATGQNIHANVNIGTLESMTNSFPAFCLIALGLIGLAHDHALVRYRAIQGIASASDSRVLLFFMPSIIAHLEEERNGVIVVSCIRSLIMSPSFLAHKETSLVALNALLRIIRPAAKRDLRGSYHAGIVALAGAAKIAPGLSTSLLLDEVNSLKDSFGLIRSQTKTAVCAAVLELAIMRPARATSFIPFVSLCISKESMETAPEAAAFCFEIMNVMAEEGVLDPVKALKIVLKSFPSVRDVDNVARRSYLLLLGAVSEFSDSRKGKVLAEKTIETLRGCIVELCPGSKSRRFSTHETLTWEQTAQAAASLAKYDPNDILRIPRLGDEPLLDREEEKARLEMIETECMHFTGKLLSVTHRARLVDGSTGKPLEALLHKIVEYEWKNRSRSSFDPERIAKLRATSEALRRARQTTDRKKTGEGSLNEDDPVGRFQRATESLPTGAIKEVCQRCVAVSTFGMAGHDPSVEVVDARAVSIFALLKTGAITPALPWVAYVEHILLDQGSSQEIRGAALAVLSSLADDSFQVAQSRANWFGNGSALFDNAIRRSSCEARELFIGMMLHYPEEILPQLRAHKSFVTKETILMLIDATTALASDSTGFQTGVAGLVEVVCGAPLLQTDATFIEKKTSRICLSRCPVHLLESMLQPSTDDRLSLVEASRMRLACHVGNFTILRAWILKALRIGSTMQEFVPYIGIAISKLSNQHRRTLLFDLCGAAPAPNDEIRTVQLSLASYCLRVAALLPDAETALAAAKSVCDRAERTAVASFVERLFGRAS